MTVRWQRGSLDASDLGTIPASYRGLVASARRHAARRQTVIFSTSRGTRLKMTRRQMYGRAGFTLLRILLAS
jgi:hypothetical protein